MNPLSVQVLKENVIQDFSCGDSADDQILNKFLKERITEHKNEFACTTFIFRSNRKIIGYLTLSTTALKVEDRKLLGLKINYPEYPGLRIGRMAVQKDFQGTGVGKHMFEFVVGLAYHLNKKICGVRFIIVDAKEKSKSWYTKIGFLYLDVQKNPDFMYYDIKGWKK